VEFGGEGEIQAFLPGTKTFHRFLATPLGSEDRAIPIPRYGPRKHSAFATSFSIQECSFPKVTFKTLAFLSVSWGLHFFSVAVVTGAVLIQPNYTERFTFLRQLQPNTGY
jgi:hypothetical protein